MPVFDTSHLSPELEKLLKSKLRKELKSNKTFKNNLNKYKDFI